MVHLCNADAEWLLIPLKQYHFHHTIMFGLNHLEPELINAGSMWRKQWPGGKTKNRSSLGVFCRQHCRLSIYSSFGWVWQILRIWDEQACLMVVTIPAEIHNQWKEVSFGLPNSLGDDLFLGWAHGVLCPHISSPISFDGLADFSAVSGRGHYSARNTQSIKRSICWFVRPRGVTYRCVGPTTFCVLT